MAVRRNIIVSPGVSQLFPHKLRQLDLPDDQAIRTSADMASRDRRGSAVQPPLIDGENMDDAMCLAADTIAKAIDNVLGTPVARNSDAEGPLGAELTTLLSWEKQLQNENRQEGIAQPALRGARVAVLPSHTWSGLLAAHVLKRVLTSHWNMEVRPKNFVMIDGLCQRPVNPTAAMENLARVIIDCLEGFNKGDAQQWENTFLMTSGFKSIIPCMTIFSLLYGVEMIYTFEESDAVQRLHPRHDLNDPKSRKFWEETWKGMRSQHWADESTNAYLRHALLGRLSDPKKSFSSKS